MKITARANEIFSFIGYTDRLVDHLLTEYTRSPSELENSLFDVVGDIPDPLCKDYHHPDLYLYLLHSSSATSNKIPRTVKLSLSHGGEPEGGGE